MFQIQVLDFQLSYQLLGQKTSVKLQSPSPSASGALQALAFTPSKGKIVMATLTGLVAGAVAGHISLALREHLQTVQAAVAP